MPDEDNKPNFFTKLKENTTLGMALKIASAIGAIVSIVGAVVAVQAYFLTKTEYNRFKCINNIELEAVRNETLVLTLNKQKVQMIINKNRLLKNENRTDDDEIELETQVDAIRLTNDLINDATKSSGQREKDRNKCLDGDK